MSGPACGVCGRVLAAGDRATFRRVGTGEARREVLACLGCFRPCVVPGCGREARAGETCDRCDRAIRWAKGRA